MSFASRWTKRAFTDTVAYWNTLRAAITIAGPIIGTVLWAIYKKWDGREALMQVAVISLLLFFALWGIAFFVNLILVPGKLDSEIQEQLANCQRDLSEIQAEKAKPRISIAEQKQRELVAAKLEGFTEQEREILEHLLLSGRQTNSQWMNSFPHLPWVPQTINRLLGADLVHRVPMIGQSHAYEVNPAFAGAIKFHMHGE